MARSAPHMRLSLVFFALCLGLVACKSPCRQLSEKLCDCSINSAEKNGCVTRAGNAEGVNEPSEADQATCKALLETCDCRLIDTAEGKVRCGLARPAP